ncbi:uncharacterized protein LOC141715246 [Apium graveolens]|uniref:uncharacterized protein LOC141715246 n=1 Tax=Apium graveolens TaxID=4045 RepID=UPI003D7AE0BC
MASWKKPISNYCKLNVQGLFNISQRKSSVGCIIRDSNGYWVMGCGGVIGLEHDKLRLMVECEDAEAMQQIMYPDPNHPMADLVTMITNLLSEKWDDLQVYHTTSSSNTAADALANHCLSGEGGIDEFEDPPYAIKDIIAEEGAN